MAWTFSTQTHGKTPEHGVCMVLVNAEVSDFLEVIRHDPHRHQQVLLKENEKLKCYSFHL